MGIFSAWYLTSCIRNKKVIRTINEHEYGELEVYVILISSIVIAPLFLFFCAYDSYLYFNPAPASNKVVLKPITNTYNSNYLNTPSEPYVIISKRLDGPVDCTQDCKINGKCSLVNGQCTILTHKDCIRSDQCKIYGRCMQWGIWPDHRCKAISNSDCRSSLNCKEYGFCSIGKHGCEAHFEEDCVKSEICKKYGFCSAVKGKCEQK